MDQNLSFTLSAIDNASAVFANVDQGLVRLESTFKGLAAAVGVGFGVAYFEGLVTGSIDAMAHLNDLTKSTALTLGELAGLKLLAAESGTDLDSMAKAIDRMSVAMGKNPEKFLALGVTAKDNTGALKQLSDIFNSLTDVQQRNALAQAVFKKSWDEIAPVLSLGSQKIGEIMEKGKELSPALAENAAKAQEFKARWAELSAVMENSKMATVGDMLPGLTQATKAITEAYREAGKLQAAWVAIGALGAFLFTDDFNSDTVKMRNLQDQMRNMQKERDDILKDGGGFLNNFFFGKDTTNVDKRIKDAQAQIAVLTEKMKPVVKPTETPEEKAAKDKAAKDEAARVAAFLNTDNADKTKDYPAMLELAALKARQSVYADFIAQRKSIDDAFHAADLISEDEYYGARKAQIQDKLNQELQIADQEAIAIGKRHDAATGANKNAEQFAANKELVALNERVAKAQQDAAAQGILLDLQQTQAQKQLTDEVKNTLASILELGGDPTSAAYIRLSVQYEDLIKKTNLFSGAAKDSAVSLANSWLAANQSLIAINQTLRESDQLYSKIQADSNLATARIDAGKMSGSLTDIEQMRSQSGVNESMLASLADYRMRILAIADSYDAMGNHYQAAAERIKAEGLDAEMAKLAAQIDLVGNKVRPTFEDAFATGFETVMNHTKSFKDAFLAVFSDTTQGVNKLVARDLSQQLMRGLGLSSGAGGASGGSQGLFSTIGNYLFGTGGGTPAYTLPAGVMPMEAAKGDAFFGGRALRFASGGIFSSPTVFRMANGTGLMGEAGPEAVMPLRRTASGQLGVAAGGGGGGSINIYVTTPDANSFRASKSQMLVEVATALQSAKRNM